MIKYKNFANTIDPDVGGETVFENCNFSQKEPTHISGDTYVGNLIFTDGIPRTFIGCNLINCEVPEGSTVVDCNTTIKRFRVLTGTDILTIDGFDIDVNIYSNIIYGRVNSDGTYTYAPTPIEIQIEIED